VIGTTTRLEQFSNQHYAREVRRLLPPEVFRPAPTRLLWLAVHLAIIGGAAAIVVGTRPSWYVALACALIAGHSWACLGFLAHEVLHHAVVRNRTVERLVGYCGLVIFCLSPTLWIAWHNQQHHGHTGDPTADPDHFGTLESWRESPTDRAVVRFAPGSGHKRSALFPFVTFSAHTLIVLLSHSRRDDYYARVPRRTVYLETAAMYLFWLTVFLLVGAWSFLFVAVVPALIANGVAIAYIATNHFLNPLTTANDPLVSSLSVRSPRWLERLHLNFGYHVEHHVLPTVSARHAPRIRAALRQLYGDRYLSLPHTTALRLLYTRPKVHDGHERFIDPRSGATFNALRPGDLSMASADDANP
jgi:fatty acid desaturase